MFQNTRKFRVEGNATNRVGGDQYINCSVAAPAKKAKEHDNTDERFSQFPEIVRGNIHLLRTLGSSNDYFFKPKGKQKSPISRFKIAGDAKRTMFTAALEGKASKVTVVTYQGKDARTAWKKDFDTYSRLPNTESVQLLGINRSEIPSLIFHNELVPLGQFYDNQSVWMQLYISHLAQRLECGGLWQMLWMDTSLGNLVSGPVGPRGSIQHSYGSAWNEQTLGQIVPATVDMLNQDVSFRYFLNHGSLMDKVVIDCAVKAGVSKSMSLGMDTLFPQFVKDIPHDNLISHEWKDGHYLESLWLNKRPHTVPSDAMNIIRGLDFTTLYSGKLEPIAQYPPAFLHGWQWQSKRFFPFGILLANGLTRFNYFELTQASTKLILEGWYYQQSSENELTAQLPWILNGLESADNIIRLEPPRLILHGSKNVQYDGLAELFSQHYTAKEDIKPIYLFIYPFIGTTISGLMEWETGHSHFWSFDKSGQSEIPRDECKELGLPELTASLLLSGFHPLSSMHLKLACDAIHDWQIARGFDPATPDFARHLGYPAFEIIGSRSRFKEVVEPDPVKEDNLGLSWLWPAFLGSDISACLC